MEKDVQIDITIFLFLKFKLSPNCFLARIFTDQYKYINEKELGCASNNFYPLINSYLKLIKKSF